MPTATLGRVIPALKLPATGDQTINLKDLRGKNVVIYFYPKDSTPGCTTEGENFSELYAKFKKLNCEIFGISRDSLKSHSRR